MSIVIVLDCGATNLRAIAIDAQGKIVASHYIKNTTKQDEKNSTYHIWDFDEIWQNLVICAQQVIRQVDQSKIVAITVTTFGVDGAPFDKNGKQIYPVISWKCPRTIPVMKQVEKELDRLDLFCRNGVGDYSFNTLYKLRWLKQYEPEVFAKMDKFVFISSMITHKLTGRLTTDYTMAGTSMLTNLNHCHWDPQLLDYLQLTTDHFPPLVFPGEHISSLTNEVVQLLGLEKTLPVISAGHDTQFALVGSGAAENQVFLSSGTWEILMVRSHFPQLSQAALDQGVTVEFDSIKGLYNPAVQWLSSAVVEWVANQFYANEKQSGKLYETMIAEANTAGVDAGGVTFNPNFSINDQGIGLGEIKGLSIHSTRGQVYRAALEGLSSQLKERFDYLNEVCHFSNDPVVVVGGGSKNNLWNQLRANKLQRPLHIVEQTEATVIGAAMFAFVGAHHYSDIQIAQQEMKPTFRVVIPE